MHVGASIMTEPNIIPPIFKQPVIICIILISSWVYATPTVPEYQRKFHQAQLYEKNGFIERAKIELESLYRTQQGKRDFRVIYALCNLSYSIHRVTDAVWYLSRAYSIVDNDTQREQLNELHEHWSKQFGRVEFVSNQYDVQMGSISLERLGKQPFNKHSRASLQVAQEDLQSKLALPISIYLPYGHYRANSVEFSLRKNQPPPSIKIPLNSYSQLNKKDDTHWKYITLSGVAALATGVGIYFLISSFSSSSSVSTNSIP